VSQLRPKQPSRRRLLQGRQAQALETVGLNPPSRWARPLVWTIDGGKKGSLPMTVSPMEGRSVNLLDKIIEPMWRAAKDLSLIFQG